MSRGKKIAKENINTEQAAVTNQELLVCNKDSKQVLCGTPTLLYAAP
ncbi:MAG: hypothetical protein ACLVBP_16370 [Ruminococcus sp.]